MQNNTLIHTTDEPMPTDIPTDGWVLVTRYPGVHYTRWYTDEAAAMTELQRWTREPHASEIYREPPAAGGHMRVSLRSPSYVVAMPYTEWAWSSRMAA